MDRRVFRVRIDPRNAFFWHAFFLAVTTSFTEVNTVMPALVLRAGGSAFTVGALTAIMLGLPLITQLFFAGYLSTRQRKKPQLLSFRCVEVRFMVWLGVLGGF